jgi:hypothetical protein
VGTQGEVKGMTMKKPKRKALTPMQADTFDKVCRLPRDNFSVGDFWIMSDSREITVCHQRIGEYAKATVSIPKQQFDKFIRWYTTGKTK